MIPNSPPSTLLQGRMPCRLCEKLSPKNPWSLLQAPWPHLCNTMDPFEPWIQLEATYSEIVEAAKSGCPFYSVIRDGILRFANSDDVTSIQLTQWIETMREERLGQQGPFILELITHANVRTRLEFYTTDASVKNIWPQIPLASHISADSSSPGCFNQARRWLDRCIQNHASNRCPPSAGAALPTRVICVGDALTDPYLYESAPEEKGIWAALSYCWGKARTMTTTTVTFDQRKAGFALGTLPETCRDAILVARGLSIPYLWIDSFCILQDSPTDWEREAANMCYIYENALVTFAALHSPTSASGLFLPNPYRRTIRLDTNINGRTATVYARGSHNVGILGFMHGHLKESSLSTAGSGILETRGWTLQEIVLSPRILWFSSSELGWSCWSSTACECDPKQASDFIDGASNYLKISSDPKLNQGRVTDWLATWRNIVHEFTKRDLTVPTDRLPAISGLASAMQHQLNSNYLAGLWESDLARQLLWASTWNAFSSDLSFPLLEHYAPSWSWASVSGAIRFVPEAQRSRYSMTWQVLSVQFRHLDSYPFGRGEGSVTIEGKLLPVRWVGGALTWDHSADNDEHTGGVRFCTQDDVIIDPRAGMLEPKAMADKHLSFLVAGILTKNSKTRGCDVPLLCNGLLLEILPGERKYARIGFAEPHFNELEIDGSWAIWEKRFVTKSVEIV